MKVVLATSNAGKVVEARAILGPAGIEIVTAATFVGEDEHGATYLENARAKAMALRRMIGGAVLAEDSGLEVDALGGLPGLRSARFAGPGATDDTNNAKLLRLLFDIAPEARTARYRASAVMLLADGRELTAEGVFEGTIAERPAGAGGFGYDPVFLSAGEERTAAQLSPAEKDALSHRGQALRGIADALR